MVMLAPIQQLRVSHGPSIDYLAIQGGIRVGIFDWLRAVQSAVIAGDCKIIQINTEIFPAGLIYQILGINGPRQMVVYVSALGHLQEKRPQFFRIVPKGIELLGYQSFSQFCAILCIAYLLPG